MPRRALSLTLEVSTARLVARLLIGTAALLSACSSEGGSPSEPGAPVAGQPGAAGQTNTAGAAGAPTNVAGANGVGTTASGGANAAGATSLGGAGAAGNAVVGGAAGSSQAGQAGTAATEDLSLPKPSPGCSASATPAEGNHNLKVGDVMRSYLLRKPQGYAASAQKPWPVVLALHPNGPAADYWDGTTGIRALRPLLSDKAILVMPQAVANDWRTDVAVDLTYFDALVSELESTLCVDMHRLFAMGHSGGGSYSGVLGCMRPDIRAFAASGAVIYFDKAACVGKAAAWITIGVDEAIPERIDYRDFFRTNATCAETSKSVTPAGCVVYDCPDPKRPIEFCSHVGGHEWPDYGSQATVDFFKQF
jgi:polyhydroxybutyrate depolymerase